MSSPRAESRHPPLFSVSSQRSCQSVSSPWFLYALCVHPAFEHFYLSHATPFGVSKLCSHLWLHSCHSSRGRKEVLPWFFCMFGPCYETLHVWSLLWGLWLMATLSWKPPPLLFDCSWIPCWNSWELSHTQAPHSVWPWGSWDQAVLPRILPHFSTWVLFKQGCPSPD